MFVCQKKSKLEIAKLCQKDIKFITNRCKQVQEIYKKKFKGGKIWKKNIFLEILCH